MGLAVSPETVETLPRSGAPQNSAGSINAAEASTRGNATAKAFQIIITVFLFVPPAEPFFDRLLPGEEWHDSLPSPVTAVTGRAFFLTWENPPPGSGADRVATPRSRTH